MIEFKKIGDGVSVNLKLKPIKEYKRFILCQVIMINTDKTEKLLYRECFTKKQINYLTKN